MTGNHYPAWRHRATKARRKFRMKLKSSPMHERGGRINDRASNSARGAYAIFGGEIYRLCRERPHHK